MSVVFLDAMRRVSESIAGSAGNDLLQVCLQITGTITQPFNLALAVDPSSTATGEHT